MRLLKVLLMAILCASLLACQEDKSPSPTPGAKPGKENKPPEQPISCEAYKEFLYSFTAMKAHAADLSAQDEETNRIALASALFAEHLRNTYSIASTIHEKPEESQTRYLQYFGFIFTKEGQVRTTPAHPLTKQCREKE